VKKSVLILGLGHIGASLAARLSSKGWRVLGWDKSAAAVKLCRRKGWIAGVWAPASRAGRPQNPGLCLIALPETAIGDRSLLRALARLERGTLVSDVFSSKGAAVAKLQAACASNGLRYAWSHPLAGREGQGAASADPTIFEGAACVLDSGAPARARRELAAFWRAVGCRVEYMSRQKHQRLMASGTHLMHVLAFAVAHAVGRHGKVTPSVLGVTRVAKSSPEGWAAILASNRKEVAAASRALAREITRMAALVQSGRSRELERYLRAARSARVRMEAT
jgi:prephenate dehydrogenase